MIFNTIGGGIGEYQYVETKNISGDGEQQISFNGAGIIFASGEYVGVVKVNGVDVDISLFRRYIEGTTRSIVAPFENGITLNYYGDLDYVYYKKI